MTIEIYLSDALVARKVCDITDVGDSDSLSHACGTVSVVYSEKIEYRPYHDQPSWQQRYTETDTPAQGYQLVRRVLQYSGSGSGTPPDDDTTFINPFVYPDYRSDNYLYEFFNVRNPDGTWTATIRLYFTPVTPGHTHKLVNSFDRSTPVQLVYDPVTNKLVADY